MQRTKHVQRRLIRLTVAAVFASAAGPLPVVAQVGTAFVGGTVITMGDAGVVLDGTVLVRGDSIIAVGRRSAVTVPRDFRVIRSAGRYLIPGLIDSHVHLSARGELAANLRHGVTSVLQMSGQRGALSDFLALRRDIDRGALPGPRLFLTGPIFDVLGLPQQGSAYSIQSTDAIPALMRRHRADGYEFIKVHNRVPPEVYRELTRSGMPVVGHIPMGMTLDEVLASGQAMIAHAELFYYNLFGYRALRDCGDGFWRCVARARADTGVIDSVVARTRRSGIVVTANLAYLAAEDRVYSDFAAILGDPEFAKLDRALQDSWRSDGPDRRSFVAERRQDLTNRSAFTRMLVARLAAAGVPVLAGTDAPLPGLFPGKAMHLELRELVRAGLTPHDAVRAATATPGEFLHKYAPHRRRVGRIERGYAADVVMLDASPLADIAATERIAGTMARGVWVPTAVSRTTPP